MRQSSQVSERGSRLQRRSRGAGSQLGVAINRDPRHSRATAPPAGTQQAADPGRLTFFPREERRGRALRGSAGFGDSTGGPVPEIDTRGHRPGEHGVRPETGETGVTDCFSLGAH